MTLITPTEKVAKRAIAALKLADKGWRVEVCCENYPDQCRKVTNGTDHFALVSDDDGRSWVVEGR